MIERMDFEKPEPPTLKELSLVAKDRDREENRIAEAGRKLKAKARKNIVTAVSAGAVAVGALGARDVKAQSEVMNLSYSPAVELNVGHVESVRAVPADKITSGLDSLNQEISQSAFDAGIKPESIAFLEVRSDIAKDQREKGRGGDARGGYVAILTDTDGHNYFVGDRTPGGSVGAIKDVTKPSLSITSLDSDPDNHPGYLFNIDKSGTTKNIIYYTPEGDAAFKQAELIVVEGYNEGKPIERTIPFLTSATGQLASLDIPPSLAAALESATPTPEVINYGICSPEKFKDCVIPEEDLYNGNYLAFLKTLSKEFEPERINNHVPLEMFQGFLGGPNTIIYRVSSVPNFARDESDTPFRRNVTAGFVNADINEGKVKGKDILGYIVLPVEYPHPLYPTKKDMNIWVLGITPLYSGRNEQNVIDLWKNQTRIPIISMGSGFDTSGEPIPLIERAWAATGRPSFKDFLGKSTEGHYWEGNPVALDGQVVQFAIRKSIPNVFTSHPRETGDNGVV